MGFRLQGLGCRVQGLGRALYPCHEDPIMLGFTVDPNCEKLPMGRAGIVDRRSFPLSAGASTRIRSLGRDAK